MGQGAVLDAGRRHSRVELDLGPGLQAEFVHEQPDLFHVEGVAALALGRRRAGAAGLEALHDLGHQARFVGVVQEVGEQARGPDAAETAILLDNQGAGAAACRGDGGRDACGATPADDHIVVAGNRDGAGWLV